MAKTMNIRCTVNCNKLEWIERSVSQSGCQGVLRCLKDRLSVLQNVFVSFFKHFST